MISPELSPSPLPDFLPAEVCRRLAGNRFTLPRLPEAVRQRMRTPERIAVSEHAAKYRMVTEEPHVGPWRHELAPHTVKIMDTFCKPYVREGWFCGVDQSGKTNTMLNCLHWAIDIDPGDCYYLMPTESTADKVVADKIIPMIKQSKRLRKHVSDRDADMTLGRIRLKNGVTIRPAYANSPSSTATFSAKYCFGDEVDKYPMLAGTEASPIQNIKKRNRLYKGRYKRFFASTPADRFIYKGTMDCHQVWEEHHQCPHCAQLFRPTGEGLVIPEGLEQADINADTEIFYTCTECGAQIGELARMKILADPCWVCIKGAEVLRPSKVGFLHRAWDCLDVPLHEIAAAWLAALTGDLSAKKDWAHGIEAVDYIHEQIDRDEDFILRLVDKDLPREVVPAQSQRLLIMADTQQVGFFYQIWAIGWGKDLPVTVIDHGFVKGFSHLVDLSQKEFLTADGKAMRPASGFIDSGGGTNPAKPQHSRTAEVYDFCRKYKFFKPLKGRQQMELPWNVKRIDFYPSSVGKKVPIPGGLNLYTIHTTIYKDELDLKLQHELNGPGCIRFHREFGKDAARQLTAEYRDERGYWQCPSGKANHHWDIMVYGLALADIMGLKNKRLEPLGRKPTKPSKGGGFVHNF
jgi:phage terminase large subunit GpA-like protein